MSLLPSIPSAPSLSQLQQYQADICRIRGWDQTGDLEAWLFFSEEVGELAKAIRQHKALYVEKNAEARPPLQEEFADVLSYLLELANRFGVDLTQAYRDKEAKNAGRTWT